MPYADKLKEYFYEGMGRETSVYLFGSAATGNWVPGRSDLDLVVLVPKEKLFLLGQKVRDWTLASENPILDGYADCSSSNGFSATRLDAFVRVNLPSDTRIDLVDQWSIKYRSKHLFGDDALTGIFPEISHSQLRAWALETLGYMKASNPGGFVPEPQLVLSKLIWTVSWAARMLMLVKGETCDSKREALQWLANEHVDVRSLVSLLLEDYSKSDEAPLSITSEQSVALRKFCLGQLFQGVRSNPHGWFLESGPIQGER